MKLIYQEDVVLYIFLIQCLIIRQFFSSLAKKILHYLKLLDVITSNFHTFSFLPLVRWSNKSTLVLGLEDTVAFIWLGDVNKPKLLFFFLPVSIICSIVET